MSTLTTVRTPVVTITEPKAARVSLRKNYEDALIVLAAKQARIKAYKKNPAKNAVGEALPMPLRFTISETTAKRKLANATAAYIERYGKLPTR